MKRGVLLLSVVAACTPAVTPHAKKATLSFHEQRVMDMAKGLPTDSAATMDEYNRHSKTIVRRRDREDDREYEDPAKEWAAILAKFGRRVDLQLIRYAVVNERGDDFAAIVANEDASLETLVRKGSQSPWEKDGSMNHGACNPVFVGNDLVYVELENGGTNVVVHREKSVAHRIVLPEERQRFEPEQLTEWNGHWILEFDGDVIIDGESLKKRGYDEVFDWMLVGNEPLFFFVKSGHTGISHAGKELGVSYDHVLHGGCCEPGAYNPRQTSWGVHFHARHGVTWYYVEAAPSQ